MSQLCDLHAAGGCGCALVATGTEQSLDELEFARSACAAAQHGDVEKLRRLLKRNPAAVHADASEPRGCQIRLGGLKGGAGTDWPRGRLCSDMG
jgi:hypothetical protein